MKKDLNFEVNILPTLDILSVLICFLLLTAVWMHVGTIDTHQALGDNTTQAEKNPVSLWIALSPSGNLQLSLRDLKPEMKAKVSAQSSNLQGTANGVNWKAFEQKIDSLKQQIPDLKTVVITPEATARYEDVIKVMDQLKRKQLTDIGLSPLG